MAIWNWIIVSWLLSYLVLDKKGCKPTHLLWMLLPVDMYGIDLFGFTVKPYMIFCLCLLFQRLLQRRSRLSVPDPWLLRGLFAVLSCILINIINCLEMDSIMGTLMMLAVWGCTMIYAGEYSHEDRESICNVLQATGIGYGLAFIAGYLIMQYDLRFPGLVALGRFSPGVYMGNANVVDGSVLTVYRLRGFTIDPNTMIGTFLYCAVVSSLRIIRQKITFREILGLGVSVYCIVLSGSRMGLVSLASCYLITLMAGRAIHKCRAKKLFLVSGLILVGCFIYILLSKSLDSFLANLEYNFGNRSGLNDDYGRLTIWKDAASIWINEALFLGVGMSQMVNYTFTERSCHNSWLEILCAWGAIVGGMMIYYLFTPIVRAIRRAVESSAARKDIFFWTMLLGTMGVMASLFTVDNVTYSYLWFGLAMVASSASAWKGDKK